MSSTFRRFTARRYQIGILVAPVLLLAALALLPRRRQGSARRHATPLDRQQEQTS